MRSEIVSVGTELLMGQIVDTNAAYLAHDIVELGIDLYWISQVGDNIGRLSEVISRAWQRSDLTVITGGLGPTEDDLTRDAIAAVLNETLRPDKTLEETVTKLFRQRGVHMVESNLRQALVIDSATSLPNPVGTAPGWWVERDGKIIVAMPGVPSEMTKMWTEQVVPRLRARQGSVIWSKTLKVYGLGESTAEDRIRPLLSSTNPTIGTYAKRDGIHLRLTAKAPSQAEAMALISPVEGQIRQALGRHVYGVDDESLEGIAVGLLRARSLTLAVSEEGTSGSLCSAVANVPEYGTVFRGGVIHALGTLAGAGSTDDSAILAEARRIRDALSAHVGLATVFTKTDIQTGTLSFRVAVALPGTERSAHRLWSGDPKQAAWIACLSALNLLRLSLIDS